MRFYVSPDRLSPPRPYIIPNVVMASKFNWKLWLDKGWSEHVILDSGVETVFMVSRMRDYPSGYWLRFQREMFKARGDSRVWMVIPDYPDDYEQGMTYERGMDNVDKTFRNIERWIKVEGVEWMPVLQSRFLDRQRFVESCERMRDFDPVRVGIGTVCKTKNLPFIRFCLETARRYFPKAWIHAFGITLKALPHARHYIDSCDSASHIIYLLHKRREMGWSSTDKKVADKAIDAWLRRAEELVSQPKLSP